MSEAQVMVQVKAGISIADEAVQIRHAVKQHHVIDRLALALAAGRRFVAEIALNRKRP